MSTARDNAQTGQTQNITLENGATATVNWNTMTGTADGSSFSFSTTPVDGADTYDYNGTTYYVTWND